jgi:hypothetical protein
MLQKAMVVYPGKCCNAKVMKPTKDVTEIFRRVKPYEIKVK